MATKDEKNDQWSATQVWNACEKMQTVERQRAYDRALIDNQFNGGRPYTPEEVRTYQIHINVNWLEGQRLLSTAINQLNNALIFKERFFTAISRGGKTEKKEEYSESFTDLIHEPLKCGQTGIREMYLLKSRNASVALHGVGALLWMNGFRWRPRFIPIEDLLIPTDALCDFSNLMFFAVNLYLTAGEFFDMTHSDKVDSCWDLDACRKILDDLVKPGQQQAEAYDYQDRPEQWVEWMKQNRIMWDLDAASTVKLRMFFYKDPKTKKWYRCVMLKTGTTNVSAETSKFLYDGRKVVFADSIHHILHVQYGDNSMVAPLKYHSVRGLGVLLYSAVECNNRLRCEFVQHVFFNLKTLLKISNPQDRDRPKVMDLSNYSVIEDGIDMIPANARYQIDSRLIDSAMSQMRQLMSESSASFVQNINDGTQKEMTATETNARVQSVNVQVSAMLQLMYAQEEFMWEEEVRRYCEPNSEDPEVEEFQEKCIAAGIPKELLTAKNWKIKIERTLGGGDQFLANQEATQLLQLAPQLDPPAQRIVKRKYISTLTRDPKMGELLVPSTSEDATDGQLEAEDVFGSIMEGANVSVRHGIERTDYIAAILGMTKAKVEQITQTAGVPTASEITGLDTAIQHVQQNIQILEQDPTMKQQVKQFGDLLGQIGNEVKMLTERFTEQQQQQNSQPDPETMAKVQTQQMLAQGKLQINQQSAAQKMQIREAEFEQKQKQFAQQMTNDMERFRLEMMTQMTKANAEIAELVAHTKTDIEMKKKISAATPKKEKTTK